uniref:Uncharacterized protein n=1 Tax=Fagus sylvatica TaxID=28930 RepID=A0A2N9HXL9_FAGSY
MSFDSDSPPSSSRDWFFPSPAFIHTPYPTPKYPKYPRRFTANPRNSLPYCPPDPRPPRTPSFRDVSDTPYRDFKYARTRRRVDLSRQAERPQIKEQFNDAAVSGPKNEISGVSVEKKSSFVNKIIGFSARGLKIRWQMAVSVAILITVFSSLLHKNFSLQNQVNELQTALGVDRT